MTPGAVPRIGTERGAAAAVAGATGSPDAGAAADTRAMATAMAEQAKAMAAMAATYMGADLVDPLSESALFPGGGVRGARGAAALHAWRRALTEKPQVVTARVRANRNRVMSGLRATPDLAPSMRGCFGAEVPFGHAKTAAYLVFGICDVADLMEAQRWHEAEAVLLLLLAAAEQAARQEWQWGLAWLLTFSAEPPWARIRVNPPVAGDMRCAGQLADPELLAAAVGHMKDVMAIAEAQKRSTGNGAAAGAAGGGQTTATDPTAGGAVPKAPRRPRGGAPGPNATPKPGADAPAATS